MRISPLEPLWSEPSLDADAPPSSELARRLSALLSLPQPLDEVEDIEAGIKQLWRSRLSQPRMDRDAAQAFVRFFQHVGFTYKYKPYGVKIASPFGYSIFDLNQNEGFSFQVHTKPKREAFHILNVKDGGFVFLCSRQEWEDGARDWVQDWAVGNRAPDSQPFVWIPSPGQTIPVSAPDVVHTVIGCVLEEFASCSVDAVDRLFDQNSRNSLTLPESHPRIGELIAHGHGGLPIASVVRAGSAWLTTAVSAHEPIIEVPDGLSGRRLTLCSAEPEILESRPGWVTSLMPVSGVVEVLTSGLGFTLRVGEILSAAPGWEVVVEAHDEATLAVHSVASEIVLQDWS